jgi:hypothetical protein
MTTDLHELRQSLLADTLACLRLYDISIRGTIDSGSVILETKSPKSSMWLLTDNGGEFNVWKINDPAPCRSVPYDTVEGMLDGGTMSYRITAVIHGDVIDYEARHADLLEFAGVESA